MNVIVIKFFYKRTAISVYNNLSKYNIKYIPGITAVLFEGA